MSVNHNLIIGHRGARGLYPENTLSSFIEAVNLGVDAIELDVVISKDLQVVVSHEAWMHKDFCSTPDGFPVPSKTRHKYNLFKMNYEEIRQFDCGKRGNAGFPQQKPTPEHKPLLSEVFQKVNAYTQHHNLAKARFLIEIKSEPDADGVFNPEPEQFVELVYAEINAAGMINRVSIQSFDPRILDEMRKLDSTLEMAFLVENSEPLEYNLELIDFLPKTYSPDFRLVTPSLVEEVHNMNMQLVPWTVNETSDMERLLAMGVDGLITDYPDRALAYRNKIN